MLTSSAAAARVIESYQRSIRHALEVDWKRNGSTTQDLFDLSPYVTSTSRDQALASTAPEEVLLVEGSAAAALRVELSGNYKGRPISAQFSPYSGYGAFYDLEEGIPTSVPMKYWIGVVLPSGDTEWFRQFTGLVKEVEIDRASNTVQLYCLDNAEKMRDSFTIPPYAAKEDALKRGDKRGSLIDSSSVIDLAARSAGFIQGRKSTPWYTDLNGNMNTLLSVPFHGSLLPEIGMLDNIWTVHRTEVWGSKGNRAEQYTTGPDGLLALNAIPLGADNEPVGIDDSGATVYEDLGIQKYWIDTQVIPEGGQRYLPYGSWAVGAFIRWDGAGTSATKRVIDLQVWNWHLGVSVNGSTGTVNGTWEGPSGTAYFDNALAKAMVSGWNRVDVRFAVNYTSSVLTVRCYVMLNGSAVSTSTLYSGSWTSSFEILNNLVTIRNDYAISDVTIVWCPYSSDSWTRVTAADNATAQTSASLDWGRNRAMYTKRMANVPAWDIAKEVAAAEYGAIYFDEMGQFRFRNFETINTWANATPARVLTIDQVSGLGMRVTSDSVRNVWSTETKTASARWGIAYDLNDDGPPLYTPLVTSGSSNNPGELPVPTNRINFTTGDFRVGGSVLGNSRYFWIPAPELMVCPDPNNIPNAAAWNDEWIQDTPQHLRKTYTGTTFQPQGSPVSVYTRQMWYGRDFVQLNVYKSDTATIVGFWLVDKNVGRFRMRGTMINEDESRPVEFTTDDLAKLDSSVSSLVKNSLTRYGRRVVELKNNFWLQDSFQTMQMLQKVMAKYGRPIPVTDAIEVPGDPRIQIGDVIEIQDPDGYGGSIKLQIYGIERRLEDGVGLRDRYQVEVIKSAGQGIWDSDEYGRWDTSLVWS